MNLFAGLIALGGAIIIVMLIVVIAIYVAQAIFLNKFNKLVYGKGTALAWIPICNVYLLGKLTFNKIVGWVLVACLFLNGSFETTINGKTTSTTLLPSNVSSIVSNVYSIAVFGLFIYAIVKYVNLKKKPKILPQQPADQVQNPIIQQQIQQSTAVQPAESVVQEQNVMANNNVDTVQPVEQSTQPTPEVNNVVNPIEQPTPMTQPVQETNTVTTPLEQSTQLTPEVNNVVNPIEQPTPMTQPVQETNTVATPLEQSTQLTPEVNNVVNPIEQPTPMTQPVQETNTVTTPLEQSTPVAPVDQNVQ